MAKVGRLTHTEAVWRNGQNRLYFLRKLRSFSACSKMFCQSVFASATSFAAICWGSRIRASDTKLTTLIKKAGSVLGTALEHLEFLVERRMLHKLLNIQGQQFTSLL